MTHLCPDCTPHPESDREMARLLGETHEQYARAYAQAVGEARIEGYSQCKLTTFQLAAKVLDAMGPTPERVKPAPIKHPVLPGWEG